MKAKNYIEEKERIGEEISRFGPEAIHTQVQCEIRGAEFGNQFLQLCIGMMKNGINVEQ